VKITTVPTSEMTELDGVPVRLWRGQTESGIPVVLAVHRVIVREEDRRSEFERDLMEMIPPDEDRHRPLSTALAVIPWKMVM